MYTRAEPITVPHVSTVRSMSSGAPLKEVGLIWIVALWRSFTLLALVTYSPMDPAWSLRGTGSAGRKSSLAAAAPGLPTFC